MRASRCEIAANWHLLASYLYVILCNMSSKGEGATCLETLLPMFFHALNNCERRHWVISPSYASDIRHLVAKARSYSSIFGD